jgi:hypothetical protein
VFCNTLVYGDLAQMLNEMPGSLFSMEFTRNHFLSMGVISIAPKISSFIGLHWFSSSMVLHPG